MLNNVCIILYYIILYKYYICHQTVHTKNRGAERGAERGADRGAGLQVVLQVDLQVDRHLVRLLCYQNHFLPVCLIIKTED